MKKILPVDITQFISELGMLMESGISIKNALNIIQIEQEHPAINTLITAFKRKCDNGMSLAEILADYPQYFESFLVEKLKQSENMALTLNRIASYRHTIAANDKKNNTDMGISLFYVMKFLIMFVVTFIIMMTFVTPIFNFIFIIFEIKIPMLFVWELTFSDLFFMFMGGLLISFLLRKKWHTLKLHLPLLGRFYRKIVLVRYLHTCAFMLSDNTSIPQALDAAAHTVNNKVYTKFLRQASIKIAAGTRLSEALFPFFTKKITLLMKSPPQQLNMVLTETAFIYTKQLHKMTRRITSIYEQMKMVLIVSITWTTINLIYSVVQKTLKILLN
ncbi:MAG: type II secretion system F family protein [Thiomargarita sp.]|nr:type II secretion system F family protein [Thiomargarita sp.]